MYSATRYYEIPCCIRSFAGALSAYRKAPTIKRGHNVGLRPLGNRRHVGHLFWVPNVLANQDGAPAGSPLANLNTETIAANYGSMEYTGRIVDPVNQTWHRAEFDGFLAQQGLNEAEFRFNPVLAPQRELWCGSAFYKPTFVPPLVLVGRRGTCTDADPSSLTMWSGSPQRPFMCVTWCKTAEGYDEWYTERPVEPCLSDATAVEITMPQWREGFSNTATPSDVKFLERALGGFYVKVYARKGMLFMDVPHGTALRSLPEDKRPPHYVNVVDSYTVPLPPGATLRFVVREYGHSRYLMPVGLHHTMTWTMNRAESKRVSRHYGAFMKFMSVMNGLRATADYPVLARSETNGDWVRHPAVALTYADARAVLGDKRAAQMFPWSPCKPTSKANNVMRRWTEHFFKPFTNRLTLARACRELQTTGLAPVLPTTPASNADPVCRAPCTPRTLGRNDTRPTYSQAHYSTTDLPRVHQQQLRWHRWAKWYLGRIASEYVRGPRGKKVAVEHFRDEQLDLFSKVYLELAFAASCLRKYYALPMEPYDIPDSVPAEHFARVNAATSAALCELGKHESMHGQSEDTRARRAELMDRLIVGYAQAGVVDALLRTIIFQHHSNEVFVRQPVVQQTKSVRINDPARHSRMVDVAAALAAARVESTYRRNEGDVQY